MEELIGVILEKILNDEVREGRLEYVKEAREKAEMLEYHFENEYPEKLLRSQHPSEEPWMKNYRKERWQSPTKICTGRVYTFLQKIQQSDDFKIRFESDYKRTGIAEKVNNQPNSLEYYVRYNLPKTYKLDTWVFNVFLKTYLQDANAVVAVIPEVSKWIERPEQVSDLDWTRPYPQIFESEHLIYDNEEFVILKVDDWKDDKGKKWDQFMAITKEGLLLFRQIKQYREPNALVVFSMPFRFNYLPFFKAGNIICEEEDGHLIYDSVLEPCLPAWNEVLFRTDDLNVMFAVHALPQKWALKMSPCKTCNGTGERINNKNEKAGCNDCKGSGRASTTPFGLMEINLDRVSAINPTPLVPPVPPAGYIERPVDSVRLFQEDIIYKEFQGFKAIGLEILGQIPAEQSGIAKQYDRKELNTFCYSVCVHLAKVYKMVCYHIMFQRYNNLFALNLITDENVQNALPDITVPTEFDVLTASMISDMLSVARRDSYNPIIVHGIELDYTEKLYGENSNQLVYLKIINMLDPLPFKTSDEKSLLAETNGCSKEDYVLSVNLPAFVSKLTQENPIWFQKTILEQRADVERLAKEKVREINSGIVPIMPDMPQPQVDIRSVDVQTNA
ncbi:hypothetical protein EB118_09025 [bacterium]|nr:hypothetical protein [bacterium]NDD84034.1 hypothetical protein [bacterium]NDG30203.1 hypothetical protein [bacterium]